MKERADLAQGWLRKAASDLLAMEASMQAGAYDAACFHAQQSAEKHLKAYLVHCGADFPYTHNLIKLLRIAAQFDAALDELLPLAEMLTPFAVAVRYDDDFWPAQETASEARAAALRFQRCVMELLNL